jgi:uracil-DNA glycosylase
MATILSRSFPSEVKLCKKACRSCGLDIYQGPALDRAKKADVFWVGLSAVSFDDGEERLPLSPLTASGSLIHEVEAPLREQLSFYKTNIVKCAPLKGDKLRYPLGHEMEKCFPNFEWELKFLQPRIVFLLGRQVADFVLKKFDLPKSSFNENFCYQPLEIDNTLFVPVHHPSYILVYKRKQLESYINGLRLMIINSSVPRGPHIWKTTELVAC